MEAFTTLVAGAGVLVAGVLGWAIGRANRPAVPLDDTHNEAKRRREDAEAERQRAIREAEIAARESAIEARAVAEQALTAKAKSQATLETGLAIRAVTAESEARGVKDARARLAEKEAPIAALEGEAQRARQQKVVFQKEARAALEKAAQEGAASLRAIVEERELDDARQRAAHLVRQVIEGAAQPERIRDAQRLMGIASGRFSGHYLTERYLSVLPLPEPRQGRPALAEGDLQAIEAVANVKLHLADTQDAIRLEGLDGVGREVARRCVTQLLRRPGVRGEAVGRLAREIANELGREISRLGRRAFEDLQVPRAHPEIVTLVGRLNYRTSYTQNQWKHAVEAAFLCGMMADELGLDRKIARRAALMHDIGKALTHEMDGSHAVIGADYARRLGETEIVANAIGAHHTDEPFSSPYAYLVAAADAMSGARPGARRQGEDNHGAKLADLERISRNFPGVEEAFAVQGGREVRVYVRDDRVDDARAVKLSSDIAQTISDEMTFPGQIRVTVIREFKAIETAS